MPELLCDRALGPLQSGKRGRRADAVMPPAEVPLDIRVLPAMERLSGIFKTGDREDFYQIHLEPDRTLKCRWMPRLRTGQSGLCQLRRPSREA